MVVTSCCSSTEGLRTAHYLIVCYFYLLYCLAGGSHGVPRLLLPELSAQLLRLRMQVTVSVFYLKRKCFLFLFADWYLTFVRNSGIVVFPLLFTYNLFIKLFIFEKKMKKGITTNNLVGDGCMPAPSPNLVRCFLGVLGRHFHPRWCHTFRAPCMFPASR